MISEIEIHKSLSHPNVVKFERSFENEKNIFILLEMCSNQTLNDLLKKRKVVTELEVRYYLIQLISGLKYIHEHNIIHRDLKLRNLFLNDKMQLKIGDFGLAAKINFEGEKRKTICGTPNYIAPEVLNSKVGHSYEADIWSIGILIYALLVGNPPFKAGNSKETYDKIRRGAYSFPEDTSLSREVKDLIQKLLTQDPYKRLTLDQILEHEFVSGYNIPQFMPDSTLIYPPSESFCKKYSETPSSSSNEGTTLEETKSIIPSIKETEEETQIETLKAESIAALPKSQIDTVWIKKWLDYSSKYGLGYITTNNCTGVYFADNAKIILHPNKR